MTGLCEAAIKVEDGWIRTHRPRIKRRDPQAFQGSRAGERHIRLPDFEHGRQADLEPIDG